MTRLLPLLALSACYNLTPVDAGAPCAEVGYAISRRTFECTGDDGLANQRYRDFKDAYACRELDWDFSSDTAYIYAEIPGEASRYFHCSFTIGELPCELVEAYGDDFEQWLTASVACPLVVEASGS